LREIRTAGSARGDESKKLRRLGEGTAAKAADQQRGSAKATGFEGSSLPITPWTMAIFRSLFVTGYATECCCDSSASG
jgi:hypothetical protein